MPRNSLDGQVDTTLFNNVLSTQLTSDLKNKLSYRIYDYQNDTPAFTLANWVVNDTAIASSSANSVGSGAYAPHTSLLKSYIKQNAADEVTWRRDEMGDRRRTNRLGAVSLLGVRRQRDQRVLGKAVRPHQSDRLVSRCAPTTSYSWRRYNDYNWAAFLGDLGVASGAEDAVSCATSTSPTAIATSPISTPTSRRRFPD